MEIVEFEEPIIPPPRSTWSEFKRFWFFHGIGFMGLPWISYNMIRYYSSFASLLGKTFRKSIKSTPEYKDEILMKRVWKETCGQHFLKAKALEYQFMEGYCAPATVRCILKSVPMVDLTRIPKQERGPSVPAKVIKVIDDASEGHTKSSVVYGSDGYDAFLATIKLVNNPRYRVSVNFLRSALFGPPISISPLLMLLLTVFGGHFSPVVGYLEDKDLVSTF